MATAATPHLFETRIGPRVENLRLSVVREESPVYVERITETATSARLARAILGAEPDRETFGILCLSAKNELNAAHIVSVGALSQCLIHPREVFKAAILANAATVVLFHNHPSGDPTPSRDDEQQTGRLARAGDLLGIRVLDHIILGGGQQYYSFADEGRLGAITA